MRYLSAFYTDIGTQKKSNQDSLLIQEANTATGTTLLAVLCDGLGGLQKGEIASAEMIKAFSAWFQYQYPILLNQRFTADGLRESWSKQSFFMKKDTMYFISETAGFIKRKEFYSRLRKIRPIFSRRWIMEE